MDLKVLRKEKGFSLMEVAEATHLPKSSLSEWENGKASPSAEVLPRLAQFYGISIDELLGFKAPEPPIVEEVFEEQRRGGPYGLLADELIVPDSKVEEALFSEYDKVKKSFFKIGYYLTLINKYHVYERQGYATISDYAEDKLGIGSTNTYNFMKVYDMTSKLGSPREMDEKYLPYNQSQLIEISKDGIWSRDGLIYVIKPTDSVKDIREYVKLWNKSYSRKGIRPRGKTVKEALAIAEEEKTKALPKAPEPALDIAPGQTSMFYEEVEEAEEYSFVPMEESFSSRDVATAYVNTAQEEEEPGEDYRSEEFPEAPVDNCPAPERTVKDIFREYVEEFLTRFDYKIQLCGRGQGAYGFAGSLFEYIKEKGFFEEI